MYDLRCPTQTRFAALGKFGLQAPAVAIAMFGLSGPFDSAATIAALESEDTQPTRRAPASSIACRLEEARAIFALPAESSPAARRTASPRHRGVSAFRSDWSSPSCLTTATCFALRRAPLPHCLLPRSGSLGVSASGGCQLAVPRYGRALINLRRATRRRVLASGLCPALLLFLPLKGCDGMAAQPLPHHLPTSLAVDRILSGISRKCRSPAHIFRVASTSRY